MKLVRTITPLPIASSASLTVLNTRFKACTSGIAITGAGRRSRRAEEAGGAGDAEEAGEAGGDEELNILSSSYLLASNVLLTQVLLQGLAHHIYRNRLLQPNL